MNLLRSNPKEVCIIKYKQNILGFEHKTKNYIIGFKHKKHAILVHNNIYNNIINNIMLIRYYTEDISCEVNKGLQAIGIDEDISDINIDLNATLIIPKRSIDYDSINGVDINIEMLSFSEFLMYPFDKNIGISLPYELDETVDDKFIFSTQVIDPCNNINIFRKNLSIT